MKKKSVLSLLLAAIIASGCTSNKDKVDLPFIDVRKNYPEKELILTDFADVTYVHLNAKNVDYLYKFYPQPGYFCITKNTIVVYDISSCSILFFSKDGTPKSRVNRLGQGPQEYWVVTCIHYDEESDDLFVIYGQVNYIQVYSSTGEYKRKIPLHQKRMKVNSSVTLTKQVDVENLVSFDDQSFLMYASNHFGNYRKQDRTYDLPEYTTYYYISKTNGAVLESFNLQGNGVYLSAEAPDDPGCFAVPNFFRLVKGSGGFFLCNPETDTVYLYTKDKSLVPVFRKIPAVRHLDPMVYLNNVVDATGYQFFRIETLIWGDPGDRYPDRYYFRDKETNEIFRQKIVLPDYKGKDFFFGVGHSTGSGYHSAFEDENGYVFLLDLFELKQAYKENKLGGKLKELVATLDEYNDNHVFMLVHFK